MNLFGNYFTKIISGISMGFPGGTVVENLPANAGDLGLIPGLGKSPGGGNGKLLQYSCLKNSMDSGPWQATVHGGHKELDMTEQLSSSSKCQYTHFPDLEMECLWHSTLDLFNTKSVFVTITCTVLSYGLLSMILSLSQRAYCLQPEWLTVYW